MWFHPSCAAIQLPCARVVCNPQGCVLCGWVVHNPAGCRMQDFNRSAEASMSRGAQHREQAAVFLHGNYSNIIKFQEWTRQDWPRTVVSIEYWSYKTCARKPPTSCYMFNWNYAFTHPVLSKFKNFLFYNFFFRSRECLKPHNCISLNNEL